MGSMVDVGVVVCLLVVSMLWMYCWFVVYIFRLFFL